MKIAIVSLDNSEKIRSGGKHVHQALLQSALIFMGHEVRNIFPRRTFPFLVVRILFKILSIFSRRWDVYAHAWTLYCYKLSLKKQIQSLPNDFSVLFSQDPVSAVAAGEAGWSQKTVMTLHGYLGHESVNYGRYVGKDAERILAVSMKYERGSLKACSRIIAVDTKISEYLKNELSYSKHISILKNAINPESFGKLTLAQATDLRTRLGINSAAFIVLVPRRLVRKNGVDIAILALAEVLKESSSEVAMIVMGDGPERDVLEKLKKSLRIPMQSLLFIGSVNHSEAPQYYDLADTVLVPSIIRDGVEEATSLSMLEAMAARKIVIVSDIGGMKEVVLDGINGFKFEQGNTEALKSVVMRVMKFSQDERYLIAEQAYKDVCSAHDYRLHARTYLEVFSSTQA